MLTIFPSSKTMGTCKTVVGQVTFPDFIEYANTLVTELKKYTELELKKSMNLSDKLANLTWINYQSFKLKSEIKDMSPAIYSFKGDVYEAFQIEDFTPAEKSYMQKNLCIISGLYGILKPFDLIQTYRLEMAVKLSTKQAKNLYQFWSKIITNRLNELLSSEDFPILLNLTSTEYFKVINVKNLTGQVITPIFKERIKGANNYKIVPIYTKRARGLMAKFVLKNRIENISDIKKFNEMGYKFNQSHSNEDNLVFLRDNNLNVVSA